MENGPLCTDFFSGEAAFVPPISDVSLELEESEEAEPSDIGKPAATADSAVRAATVTEPAGTPPVVPGAGATFTLIV